MTYYSYSYSYSNQPNSYEFTAFSEASIGMNLGYGTRFTMPTADTCITVTDDDRYLSGDGYCSDQATDKSYQTGSIDQNGAEVGNGGKVYAEKYYWVKDAAGNKYVLIEVEQEGSNDDYFTFYTGQGYTVPPEGASLEVVGSCDINSNWLDYGKLGAGDCAPQTGSILGTVFCDTDCDGINGSLTVLPGTDYVVEAESMYDCGFKTVTGAGASGGKLVKLECNSGSLKTYFDGTAGTYDLRLTAQDETDGQSKIYVKVNGVLVDVIHLDRDSDGGGDDNGGFSDFVIEGLELNPGDKVTLVAYGSGGEFVRIDKIAFEGQDTVEYTPEPVKEGVLIKLLDLDGNVVAETHTDANGNYQFDGVPVGEYRIMGVAPDGTEFTIQDVDGNTKDDIDSDVGADGMSGVVNVVAGAASSIDLGVCDKAPEPAALGDTVWFDANRNGIQDGTEAGVADVTVTLTGAGADGAFGTGDDTTATKSTDSNGNYLFEDLEAGDYKVTFSDLPAGYEFTAQDAGGDDDIDSDADVSGMTGIIALSAGETNLSVDAGIVDPATAALKGRYFCDENDNDIDDGEPGVEGITVTLRTAGGVFVADTTTLPDGSYEFSGLLAGDYVVTFAADPAGKTFVAPNVGTDDTVDSDGVPNTDGTASTGVISLAIGEVSEDNDVGVEYPNTPPEASPDAGEGCADEEIVVDLSDNYSDIDSTSVAITMLAGQAIADGQTIMVDGTALMADGVTAFAFEDMLVTRSGDEFIFDGEAAFAALDIGESASTNISFKVEDSEGGVAVEMIDLTFCGDANSVASLCDSLPDGPVTYQVVAANVAMPIEPYAFDIKIVGAGGDERFEEVVFEKAYCISAFEAADAAEIFDTANMVTADLFCATEATDALFNAGQTSAFNGNAAVDNLDLVNWILNQDYESQGFTGWEVQLAIWELVDNVEADTFTDFNPGYGDIEDVDFILSQAALSGEGFEAGVGDVIGVILDPNPATPGNSQPFILAIDYEAYDCLC